MSYALMLEGVVEAVKEEGCGRVYLQFPEGLKGQAVEVAGKIGRETGCVPVIQVDPCYGACDVDEKAAELAGAGLIIHFGHTRFEKEQAGL